MGSVCPLTYKGYQNNWYGLDLCAFCLQPQLGQHVYIYVSSSRKHMLSNGLLNLQDLAKQTAVIHNTKIAMLCMQQIRES